MVKLNLQFFGGRGASSGGGGGGGNVGGGGAIDTESLVSMRNGDDPVAQAAADEVMSVFMEVSDQYGTSVEDIQVATMEPGSTTLAYYDWGDNIAFNKEYFDSAKMDTTYDRCVALGFHPGRGNKTGLQAVAAHELGHKLTNDVAKKLGNADLHGAAKLIMEDARKTGKFSGVRKMAQKISGYATKNNAEAISEAFADVFCNGSKAKTESRAIVNSLNKFLK